MDDLLAGRYRLGAELGRGGMARVVAAHDERLDRRVAVKLLPVDAADRASGSRFVREARSSARFSHPHAVAVYDAGVADDHLYLVMELVDGPSLADVLATDGALPVARAQRIADEVLQALGAAHGAGVVHRDVKPGNILLTADGSAKLADFGIAKRLDELSADLTTTGEFIGTPKYLSPERTAGAPLTPASDIYAVGVVLFEMLAGHAPFDEPTPLATAIAHRDAPLPDVRRTRPDVPASVAAAIARAMAKDPARRFGSADDMRAALAASPALPPTQLMTSPRPPRRHLLWWVAAGLAAAAAIVAVAVAVNGGDDPGADAPPASAPLTTVAPTTVPPTTVPPTTLPPTTTVPPPPTPATIGELIAFVDADPAAVGPRSGELRDQLADVLDKGGRAQARAADRLQGRVEDWVAAGELPAELGALVDGILAPIAADAAGGGNGNGDEDEDG